MEWKNVQTVRFAEGWSVNESEAVEKAVGDKVARIVKEVSMVKEVSLANAGWHGG